MNELNENKHGHGEQTGDRQRAGVGGWVDKGKEGTGTRCTESLGQDQRRVTCTSEEFVDVKFCTFGGNYSFQWVLRGVCSPDLVTNQQKR